ncbi:urease accessory protein UreD [Sodalis sp. dw_96]|uniref:urease accessory protein UreD n=1 Tax=Sodalis sp. dw_96 TaxID=2719794 RepID=UPI001BD3CFF9|nr:urease accessory protein UreD [Sodalis sp. dw_96]
MHPGAAHDDIPVNQAADSEATGWLGRLDLTFARRNRRTAMVRCSHSGPFTVQRAFYPEEDHPHVYLLHPPGGVVGGDRLELSVRLEQGSHAVLTMPGATKFYRSAGAEARLRQKFLLEEDSVLEWLPQGNIFFPAANVAINSEFTLHAGARLLGFETLCLGRPVMGEAFEQGRLNSLLRIHCPGSAGLYERLEIQGGMLNKLADYPLVGTFFATPASVEMLDKVRALLARFNPPVAGATLLDTLLMVRLLDDDNQRLQEILHGVWALLRPQMLGREAVPPRIWST